jgi:hypothetical protein
MVFHDFCPQGGFIEHDGSSQSDVQVFKGHGKQMGLVQGLQGRQYRFT